MKKTILNTLIAVLALGVSTVALAETRAVAKPLKRGDPSGVMKAIHPDTGLEKNLKPRMASSTKEMKGRMEEERRKMASSTEEREVRREEMQKKVDDHFGKMTDRISATIDREDAIVAKVVSRIEKVKTIGGKTDEAEKLVAEAKGHLAEARTALDVLKAGLLNVTTQNSGTTTPKAMRDGADGLRKNAGDVEHHIRAAHQALEKSIGALRGNSQIRNASSTVEHRDEVNNHN